MKKIARIISDMSALLKDKDRLCMLGARFFGLAS